MRRHLPLFTACTLLFRAGARAPRLGASKNILCTTRWETCSRLLEFSARLPRANCCRPIAAQQQYRVLSSFHSRCFSTSSSSNSNDGQASSTHTVFEPALTIPRFLRAFAIAQAAVCFVNGAVLIVLHNPLNGGSLRETGLGVCVVLFGALTLRAISAYVTCHISRIDIADGDSLLVKSLTMPFGEKQQLITRHAFHAMGSGYGPVDLSTVNATKLVYVIVDDKPHIMNVATGVLDKAACESILNGTEDWHQRQQELFRTISASTAASQQQQPSQSNIAPPAPATQSPAQKPFVVHGRFRPWTFKKAGKK